MGPSLCTEGNLCFKSDWDSLILCFTLYLKAISEYKPPGGLYLEGRFNGGFFALRVWGGGGGRGGLYLEGLIDGGAYFLNFTVFFKLFWYKVFVHTEIKITQYPGGSSLNPRQSLNP